MTPHEWVALLTLATATSFTPGPNTALSTALAANFGLRRAMRFVCAVPVGWALLLGLSAGGIGAAVVAVPALRWGILLGGVGYLLWLAWRLAGSHALAQAQHAQLNLTFLRGVMLQFLNIKAWMLALSIVAGWIAGHADSMDRFVLVLPVLMVYALASNLTYALVGSVLRSWLAGPMIEGRPSGRRLQRFNRLMAMALVLTAGWMLTSGLEMG